MQDSTAGGGGFAGAKDNRNGRNTQVGVRVCVPCSTITCSKIIDSSTQALWTASTHNPTRIPLCMCPYCLLLQVLAGFVAAGAALLAANKAEAVTPVDLFDDRKARDRGFDIIYEARDLDLPQNVRDGLTQVCCWFCVVCVLCLCARFPQREAFNRLPGDRRAAPAAVSCWLACHASCGADCRPFSSSSIGSAHRAR